MRWINLGRLAVLWLALLTGGGRLAAQYTLSGRVQDGSTGVAELKYREQLCGPGVVA